MNSKLIGLYLSAYNQIKIVINNSLFFMYLDVHLKVTNH